MRYIESIIGLFVIVAAAFFSTDRAGAADEVLESVRLDSTKPSLAPGNGDRGEPSCRC